MYNGLLIPLYKKKFKCLNVWNSTLFNSKQLAKIQGITLIYHIGTKLQRDGAANANDLKKKCI